MPPRLSLSTRPVRESAHLVELAGELDLYAAPQLKDALLELARTQGTDVVVDLTDVTLVDSTAIGALLQGFKRLRAEGGNLRLVCTNREIIRVLQITGLDRRLNVYATVQDALAARGSGGAEPAAA